MRTCRPGFQPSDAEKPPVHLIHGFVPQVLDVSLHAGGGRPNFAKLRGLRPRVRQCNRMQHLKFTPFPCHHLNIDLVRVQLKVLHEYLHSFSTMRPTCQPASNKLIASGRTLHFHKLFVKEYLGNWRNRRLGGTDRHRNNKNRQMCARFGL
jgi:hypothetical protein